MRRRFVQDPVTLELIEVSSDYVGTRGVSTDSILWNDRNYQDMGDPRFTSREQHREFMKRNGLTTADDYKGQWEKDGRRRELALQGHDPSRKQDIAEAIRNTRSGRRPDYDSPVR